MKWLFAFLTLSGINIIFWSTVGFIRYLTEKHSFSKKANRPPVVINNCHNLLENLHRVEIHEVAALVPAHNEEVCIAATLESLKKVLPKENIYVGSDASTDKTVKIVKKSGCHVVDIWPNQGKAGVLVYLMNYFHLRKRYKAVMIVDADTEIDVNYLNRALHYFDNPKIVAIAGHGVSRWRKHWLPSWSMFFISYRVRLYRMLQAMLRYGQTWKYTNVTSIVPGFASLYRTSALGKIKIDAPGLIIEDYNMTFELHHKKLGKVAYDPKVFGVAQDPYRLQDYFRQVWRWNLGFWQTVKRHGIWPSFFWLAQGLFIFEMLLYSPILLFVPFLFEWFFLTSFAPFPVPLMDSFSISIQIELIDVILGVFLIDYLLTVVVSIIEKKPILLFYGLGFIFLRLIDTYIFLATLPKALFTKSDGRWVSPKRR